MWTLINVLVTLPVAFLVNLLLARMLGVVDYGRLAYLTTVIGIVGGVVNLGLSPATLQFGAKAHAAGRTNEAADILSRAQGFRLLVIAPIMTAVVLALVRVDWPLMLIAIVCGIWVPAALDGALFSLQIENKTAVAARISLVSNLVTQALVIGVLFTIPSSDAVWAIRTIAGAFLLALCFIPMAMVYRRAVLRPRWPRGFPDGFWRFALPAGAAGLISGLALSRTEVIFLEHLSEPASVGLFALAFGVASHVFAPAEALVGPLIPAVTSLREVAAESVARAFLRTLRASSTIVGLLVAGAVPGIACLVPVLYGSEYAAATPLVILLGIAGGVSVIGSPISAFVMARLSAGRMLWANVVALVVDVALAVALIPHYGAWGAAIANAVTAVVYVLLLAVDEVRHLRISAAQALAAGTSGILGGVGALVGWQTARWLFTNDVATAFAAGTIGVLIYILLVRVTGRGLDAGDRGALESALPRKLRRLWGPVVVMLSSATK